MSVTTTQAEAAADEAIRSLSEAIHPIPPMTDPQGKYWDQPPRFDILMDDKHALMTQATFGKLQDYSSSIPTGAYPGKMWKRRNDFWDESQGWLLVWMDVHRDPDTVSIHHRGILIV